MISVIGIIIGVLIFGSGIFYFIKNKNDAESRKIYAIVMIAGVVTAIVFLLLALF